MPRGIPNAKRDETGMKYTTFHVPLAPNPKYSSSTYLKSDANTLWYRNARNAKPAVNGHTPEQRRGQQTLVIHPGSANFRIGRATDLSPVVVPAIVARKTSTPAPPLRARNRVRWPANPDEPASPDSSEPALRGLAAIQSTLDSYMSYLGVRREPDGVQFAREAATRRPQPLSPAEDTWIFECDRPYLIGDEVYRLADPPAMGYIVRRPIHGQNFAAADYTSLQAVLNDIEVIIRETLRSSFEILPRDYHNHSVVLVIPDFYETSYVREFVHLLLVQMGFKQICVQQESLAATYGAGASTACVVNFGAAKTSIACVDEGIIIPDTRIVLDIGGDDITEWLYFILHRQDLLPGPECDLARLYDWRTMVFVAEHMVTLKEQAIYGVKSTEMPMRRPGQDAVKYHVLSYDAQILAPMLYFYEFARILRCEPYAPAYYRPDTTEEIMEPPVEHATETMKRVTAHLMPEQPSTQPQLTVPLTMPGSASGSKGPSTPSQVDPGSKATTTSASPVDDSPMDVDGQDAQATAPSAPPAQQITETQQPIEPPKPLDIFYEASKTPLDAALFNSIRIAGEDRISKYLTSVLITGGPTRTHWMAEALMSRLQSAARAVMQDDTLRASVVQLGKDVDRTALVWKGAAVLGKMEGVSELWVTPADWDLLGMRGLKERCFYL
ncbi:actin-like ATPase domain-containing protein [Schizophyllum commune Loenen D]|nr:actin-like ATPase domain-containing protein [Schizophyllum commune Loenen D]